MPLADQLLAATRRLCRDLAPLRFGPPVTHAYNPLVYAAKPWRAYLRRFAAGPKRVVYLGMNPGPYGMVQTGVPFGEVAHGSRLDRSSQVPVGKPAAEHPKRLVTGLSVLPLRGEWCAAMGLGSTAHFGKRRARSSVIAFFVANYCPRGVFIEDSGRNRTPDKLPAAEREPMFAACDRHLRRMVELLAPEHVIGIGRFSELRAQEALEGTGVTIGRVLHPSPANPRANQDWVGEARRELYEQGICHAPDGAAARRRKR